MVFVYIYDSTEANLPILSLSYITVYFAWDIEKTNGCYFKFLEP